MNHQKPDWVFCDEDGNEYISYPKSSGNDLYWIFTISLATPMIIGVVFMMLMGGNQ